MPAQAPTRPKDPTVTNRRRENFLFFNALQSNTFYRSVHNILPAQVRKPGMRFFGIIRPAGRVPRLAKRGERRGEGRPLISDF